MGELGPVDLVVVSFPGEQPPDSFMEALGRVERTQGLLTDAEFAAAKARLLGT
ncbi:hypothetical protein [Streptomyces sp. NPDC051994]|uniref:hypothetical protein n=1 Tax=unclassified Streptomyces TaxID=2593676 RepID=UPI00341A6285